MPSPAIVRAMREAVGHHQAGRLAQAEEIYRRVLREEPRDADALQLLGLVHHQLGRHAEAVELIRKAIVIRPRAEFYVNLSQAYRGLGRHAESLEACERAVQMAPNLPEAWNNLGSALKDVGRIEEAVNALRKAISLRPKYAAALSNLGNALAAQNRAEDAEKAFRDAIAADPNYAEAHSNLGLLVSRLGRLDEAIELCQRAINLRPNLVAAFMNLGTTLHLQGWFDEGNVAFERGARLDPNHARLHENLLSGFNYTTCWTPEQSLEAHVAWAGRFAPSASSKFTARDPGKQLRIGFVSPDLKRHSVAYFLEPILEHLDRDRVEITAYSNTEVADEVTERLRGHCQRWRDIVTLDDDRVAEMIRQDEIDILIDLAGHTTGNRLGVFAKKPAPVQMTYLGYPNTTGMSAIDYRITDELADPPGMTEAHFSERLLRVPAPFLCYRPPQNSPDVSDPPMLRNGYVTFGSFNKAAKAGPETIALWAKVLAGVPGSKLIMKSRGLSSAGSRRRIVGEFAKHAIGEERLQLIEAEQPLAAHLAMYGLIDVALDTFPYHGTTTTCEALWMGVPVVSLAAQTHVSRVGVSLLTSIGRPEWAVTSVADFIETARSLAKPGQRARLREVVKRSPLLDPLRLTKHLEVAFRQAFAAFPSASK